MQVGNELVEQGFTPADPPPDELIPETVRTRALHPLAYFTLWVNACPEARDILESYGFVWPVVSDEEEYEEVQQS